MYTGYLANMLNAMVTDIELSSRPRMSPAADVVNYDIKLKNSLYFK